MLLFVSALGNNTEEIIDLSAQTLFLVVNATNLHDMGVPTKVIHRICRHADEATTKKYYIHATEPGVQRGTRKLEASITREKHERKIKRPA